MEGQYHLFDGDGMVHGVRLRDGRATFSDAWVRTERWRAEDAAGRAAVLKLGDAHGATGMTLLGIAAAKGTILGGATATPTVMGTANTALEFHAGRLLALNEGDLPWHLRVLCDGALETLGRCTFGGAVATRTFTAHPKLHPPSGDLHYISYQVDRAPHLTYGVLDAAGKAVHTTAVPLRFPQMIHDLSITNSYAVLWDLPLMFDPRAMVAEDRLPFTYDKSRGAQFGLLARGAEGAATRWFSLPGCMIFHSLAAWEEEDAQLVRLFACRIEDFDLALPPAGNSHDPRTVDGGRPILFEFVFDLRTGGAEQSCVIPLPQNVTGMDFPKCHPVRGTRLSSEQQCIPGRA